MLSVPVTALILVGRGAGAQYVTHFPKEEKYVSILKSPDDPVAASQAMPLTCKACLPQLFT